jgi:diguanylate cyclase (GGDEF)-like protein
VAKHSDIPEMDPFAAHRERITYALAVASVVFFLPFSINNFVQGRVLLGLGSSLIVLVLAANGVAAYTKRPPVVPLAWIILPILPTLILAGRTQGFGPLLWLYPVLLLFHFVLSRRMANALTVIVLLVIVPVSYRTAGPIITVRLAATLTVTAVFSNLLVSIIGELQEKMMKQAITDPLTGAYNRRHMESCLATVIERNHRTGAPASIVLADVDHFKSINDKFGHAAGDTVLRGVVERIQNRKRKLDSVFRIGGEEFVLLLPDTKEGDAMTVAEHIRGLIEEAQLLEGRTVTVSLGVTGLETSDRAESWLKRADDALYRAKDDGRNRVVRNPGIRQGRDPGM